MKGKNLFSVFIALSSFFEVGAQPQLSLQEALRESASNNSDLRLSALDVQVARAKLKQADAIFLPQANFSYTSATSNNPLNAFGFKLQQGSITAMDFNPKQLNNPSATKDFSTKFELQQPLLNVDKLYQYKAAGKQAEIAQLISHRTAELVYYETQKAYLNLQVAYEENKVLNEALTTSRALYKTSTDYFNQGLIQTSDLLNAELYVLNIETQLRSAQSALQDGSDRLSILMNRATGVLYTVDSMNMANAWIADIESVPDGRADFQALQKGMESFDLMIRSSKASYLPRLNGIASYQWNDKSLLGFKANSYFAGLQLSWNIFNGNRTKTIITQQHLEKEKLGQQLDQQKKEAQAQVDQSRRQLADATFMMKKQRLGIQQASEALRVLQNRYIQGLTRTTDVLTAATKVSQERLGYVQAVYDYDLAAATLQFLTAGK